MWRPRASGCGAPRRPVTAAARGLRLAAAFAGRLGGAIGLLQAEPDGNGIAAALALQALPLQGTVITGDAAFRQRAICQTIRDGQGDRLFAVEANPPTLMAGFAVAFGDAFPPDLIEAPSGIAWLLPRDPASSSRGIGRGRCPRP